MTQESSSPEKPKIFVANIELSLAEKLKDALLTQDFILSTPPYTVFSGKKLHLTCTLYKSGKLVVQGKAMAEFIEFYLEPEILGNFSYSYNELSLNTSPHIGIDESGKGDFFGPLCVAGVYADGAVIKELHAKGIRDSKTLSDKKALQLAIEIKKICQYHILKIYPEKYNQLYQGFGNLNALLAWGHATVIENLFTTTHCPDVIIDQFAAEYVVKQALARKKVVVSLTQRHRAESDTVVAAASILARAAYLEGLAKVGRDFGIELPKGAASQVITAGKRFVTDHGIENVPKVAKVHFKTYKEITP